MPPSRAGEYLEAKIFTRLAQFGLVFCGTGNGHPQSVHFIVDTGHKSWSQILFMDHLADKAGTKRPTKVPIGSSFTDATKISSERSMEPRLEGP